jgi:hypothetical protein
MSERDRFEKLLQKYPHQHKFFFSRPDWTRRQLFQVAGTGLTAGILAKEAAAQCTQWQANVQTINKAKNVIFVLLAGAPSHTDLFDLKMIEGTSPREIAPETIRGLLWPTGILPKLATNIPDLAIIRSMRSWALVHSLAQTWTQTGRSPVAVLGDIAPNIGSIIARELTPERTARNVFPSFLALNSNGAIGSGYFDSKFAPFKTAPTNMGLANTAHPGGQPAFDERWNIMHGLDDNLRINSPLGKTADDLDDSYNAARGLMYNPDVDKAFRFTQQESLEYGNTSFGNSCLVAKKVLEANDGTRFIQITLGGWDMHQNIYGVNGNVRAGNTIFTLGKVLDDGLSALINDLKASGLFENTLVVAVGEFGRTVGRLSAQAGRDHYLQQFCVMAGAGIRGGRAIGSTDATGSATRETGWSRDRDIRPEDVEATILSAMGINWTKICYDDPFGRGFEYVHGSKEDLYGPVNELWS